MSLWFYAREAPYCGLGHCPTVFQLLPVVLAKTACASTGTYRISLDDVVAPAEAQQGAQWVGERT
jgi:hypothetical protein